MRMRADVGGRYDSGKGQFDYRGGTEQTSTTPIRTEDTAGGKIDKLCGVSVCALHPVTATRPTEGNRIGYSVHCEARICESEE